MTGKIPILLGIICSAMFLSCDGQGESADRTGPKGSKSPPSREKVTFVELGSVNCIPCKMMQPIMKSIEKKYGDQIRVVFYDVWKDPAPGRKYGIRLIPTQVFLDENGKEITRHEGFLAEERIDELLQSRGLKIVEEKKAQ